MVIDGRNYRVNVLVLSMQDEVAVTLFTLKALLLQAEDGVSVSVLLNGGHSAEMQALSLHDERLHYYRVDHNLGVAGGRNRLLQTQECRDSDLVFVVDNDVVLPVDYVRRLAEFLVREEGAGVVGGIAADINNLAIPDEQTRTHQDFARARSAEIKRWVLSDLDRDSIYHMGVRKDYMYAYFSIVPKCMQVIGYFKVFAMLHFFFGIHVNVFPVLRNNAKYRKMIADGVGKYEVSNVAGCSQAFRRQLVDQLGLLDERFNPYGFEDTEFCIRSLRAGYRNYIDTNTWLLHGTDRRHAERNPMSVLANTYRGRTILGASLFGSDGRLRAAILRLIVCIFLFDFLKSPAAAVEEMKFKLEGFRRGMEAIKCP